MVIDFVGEGESARSGDDHASPHRQPSTRVAPLRYRGVLMSCN